MRAGDGRKILRQCLAVPGLQPSIQFFDGIGRQFCDLMGIHFSFLLEGFCDLALLSSSVCCQEEQLPFLAAARRAVACAVKDAGLAFIGAQRRSLTGEARECAQGFRQEGQGTKLARRKNSVA
jgi:hypothetical protein